MWFSSEAAEDSPQSRGGQAPWLPATSVCASPCPCLCCGGAKPLAGGPCMPWGTFWLGQGAPVSWGAGGVPQTHPWGCPWVGAGPALAEETWAYGCSCTFLFGSSRLSEAGVGEGKHLALLLWGMLCISVLQQLRGVCASMMLLKMFF